MAKIDFTKIEGYADMTPEQKIAALEGYEIPDPDMTGYVSKAALDKATSEAAGYKKQLREHMTAEEAAKAESEANMAQVMEELKELRAEKAESEYKAQFMAIGYSAELAAATAKAMQSGDVTTMFANHAKFVADREKQMKAELLKKTPAPPAGEGTKTVTREDVAKMTLDEKMEFYNKNPELFERLTGDD